MRFWHWPDVLSEDNGSAIVYALYATIFLSVLAALLIALAFAWKMSLARSSQLMQARYDLESAIVLAISDSDLYGIKYGVTQISLNASDAPIFITREAFGGLERIVAHREANLQDCSAEAYLGSPASEVADLAVQMNDWDKRLFLAGSTSISGDIQLNGGSVEYGSIGGRYFKGQLEGEVRQSSKQRTELKFAAFRETIARLESSLTKGVTFDDPNRTHILLDEPTRIDSTMFDNGVPVAVFSSRPLTLSDTGWIPDGSIFATSSTLTIGQGTRSEFVVYYGREGVKLSSPPGDGLPTLSGQFLSKQTVVADSLTYISYPSSFFVEGHPDIAGIQIQSGSTVEGTLVFSSTEQTRSPRSATVAVNAGATVQGAIFNTAATELGGTVNGSVVTNRFYFYAYPSSYVNWLLDATIDVSARPGSFILPAVPNNPTILQITTECRRV